MTIESNRLWVMPCTAEAIQASETHAHAYACNDHCLFIGPRGPEGSVEVNEALIGYLTREDWAWIYSESDKIRREQEEQYHQQVLEAQKRFFERFEADLKTAIAEGENGEQEQGSKAADANGTEN